MHQKGHTTMYRMNMIKLKIYSASNWFLLKNDNNDDHIRVECMDWSDELTKNQWTDSLSVAAYSKEILEWFYQDIIDENIFICFNFNFHSSILD